MKNHVVPQSNGTSINGIAAVLSRLTGQEEQIIRLRFGIGHEKVHTLTEVAQQLGVTRERLCQVEAKALRKMRKGQVFGAGASGL